MTRQAQLVRLALAAVGITFAILMVNPSIGPASQPAAQKKDPLIPGGPDDIVSDPSGCIVCHGHKNDEEAAKSRFGATFHSHEFVLLTESTTWETKDLHSRTFKVLKEPLAQRMSKGLKYDVTSSAKCLSCHGIDRYAGTPMPQGQIDVAARFEMGAKGQETPGITCNACHGLRPKWQFDHTTPKGGKMTWRTLKPEQKAEAGMRDLRDPVVKAALCVTCHVGNAAEGKVVTHEMYAAGHPPLPPFELASYMEGEPKHWGYPTDPKLKFFADLPEKDRWPLYHFHTAKEESYLARHYAAGSIATLRAEAELLLADAEKAATGDYLIDYARFDCYACHHDIPDVARQKRGYEGAPGRPPLRAAAAVPARLVAAHAEKIDTGGLAAKAMGFEERWVALRKAATSRPFGDPALVKDSAKSMIDWCNGFLRVQCECASPIYTETEAKRLRAMMAVAATGPTAADPEVAFSLTWGYRALADDAGIKLTAEANKKLAEVVPLSVRMPPFSSGEQMKQPTPADWYGRMKSLNSFDAGLFREAFGGLK